MARKYTQFDVTSRDVTIIRQHFCNDLIIKYLWSEGKEGTEARVAKVNAWLTDMTQMILKPLSEAEIGQIESVYKSPEILAREKIEREKEEAAEKAIKEQEESDTIPF